MATFIVVLILVLAVCLALVSIRNNKKKGKSIQCGGDCSHCIGGCNRKTETKTQ
ncbi:MAG: FeoB-associated Cys-rich membrane protein [Clostridiales bacterium]|nr:FeoB-associated Cys-rich membrane protein [Candidatus Blautia equi]